MLRVGRQILLFGTLLAALLLGFAASRIAGERFSGSIASIEASSQEDETLQFDFGSIRAGEGVEHTFQIQNTGSTLLSIVDIKSTCGCTIADVATRHVGPGESVGMPVSLNTSEKSGSVSQPVNVRLSDGTSRTFVLTGFVTKRNLHNVRFDSVLRGESWKRAVYLPWPPGVDLEILSIEYNDKKLFVDQSSGERKSVFNVSLKKDVPYGLLKETIRILTNDPLVPERTISVSGMVALPISVEPEQVSLGLVEPGKIASGSVRVFSPYGGPIQIEQVKQVDGMHVTWVEERRSEGEVELAIELNADAIRSYYRSVLRVTAHSGIESREFDVEIYGVGSAIGLEESREASVASEPAT